MNIHKDLQGASHFLLPHYFLFPLKVLIAPFPVPLSPSHLPANILLSPLLLYYFIFLSFPTMTALLSSCASFKITGFGVMTDHSPFYILHFFKKFCPVILYSFMIPPDEISFKSLSYVLTIAFPELLIELVVKSVL